jgi:glycosyltransferase involved in cell wall biosynthesis
MHYLLWLRQSYKAAKRLHESRHFDLAHHVTWASLFCGSPLWRLGIPFVFGPVGGGQTTPHSLARYLGRHWKLDTLRSFAVQGMRLNPLARGAVRNAAIVLATNSATVQLVRDLGARSVRLVSDSAVPPELLDRERSASGPNTAIAILWIARLLPRKGLPLALDALSRIAPDVQWKCSIVGYGPLSGNVRGWLEQFGVSDRATWVGRVPWTEIGRAYEQADVFLFTSLRDSCGSQLYEAAAMGLPIVALDHQGVSDLIPDDVAVKVPVGDPDQTAQGLARALGDLAGDPVKRTAMGEAALRFARGNTWTARVKETYAIIESSLADTATL